jgi:hypothetical protein
MFSVAYGLRCDSNEDPMLTRMEKLLTALDQAVIRSKFLVVSFLLADAHNKSSNWRSIY